MTDFETTFLIAVIRTARLALGSVALWLAERLMAVTQRVHTVAMRCDVHGVAVACFEVLHRVTLALLWLSEVLARWSLVLLPAPSDARREMLAWYDAAVMQNRVTAAEGEVKAR